jgi:hypothetical protein
MTMKLIERAKALKALGFLTQAEDLNELVKDAQAGDYDVQQAPATALLAAAGDVLEIPLEALEDLEDYEGILMAVEEFCGDLFHIEDIEILEGPEVLTDADEDSEDDAGELETSEEDDDDDDDEDGDAGEDILETVPTITLRFKIDGTRVSANLVAQEGEVDLSFFQLIDEHLQERGDDRRLCPLVEVMDDTARFVFADPAKVEQAELDEIISAPDYEE